MVISRSPQGKRARSLLFPSEEALQVALLSGLVPPEVQAQPARAGRHGGGEVWVCPSEPLGRAALAALAEAGVGASASDDDAGAPFGCWAEIVKPRRSRDFDGGPARAAADRAAGGKAAAGRVIFLLGDGGSMVELAAEMLRLGADRQEYRWGRLGDRSVALLRVLEPPYFTLACAFDRARGLRAFLPSPVKDVWIEIGHSHPLSASLRAPAGCLLLIPGEGPWLRIEDGRWDEISPLIELTAAVAAQTFTAHPAPPRIAVTLKLARAARPDPPSLWVLRRGGVKAVDGLVQSLPDDVVARVLFAVAHAPGENGASSEPIVVLRARTGQKGALGLSLPGEAYAPLLHIPNLFVPCDAIVEPPLRRERIRELLAPGPDEVYWLARTSPPPGTEGGPAYGTFQVQRLREGAFMPLAEWVDYLIHDGAVALEPWVRSAVFAFDRFESIGGEWGAAPAVEEPPPSKGKRAAKKARPPGGAYATADESPAQLDIREATEPTMPELIAPVVAAPTEAGTSADEQALKDAEERYLKSDLPIEDPQRQPMWLEMAELCGRLGRRRDVGLCFSRVVWELEGPQGVTITRRWAAAEAALVGERDPAAVLARLTEITTPTDEQTRAVATQVLLARERPISDLYRVQRWLDRHDDNLDVRTLWLTRAALADLAGGDRLGLAAARDRILAKLFRGPSLDRDVPTFLRFCGSGRDAGVVGRLVPHLEALLTRFEKTTRTRSASEAPLELTRAYVLFTFAYGFARFGQSVRARAIAQQAAGLLNVKDPMHGFLSRAYGARVEQALEGLAFETPLPTAIAAELTDLDQFSRFKMDRLRRESRILEPQERLDPFLAFQQGARDPRGDEFAAMRGMDDPARIAAEVERLLHRALLPATAAEDRGRLFDGLMDFFFKLPEAQAVAGLSTIAHHLEGITPSYRALLLEEALGLAGHFGRDALVSELAAALEAQLLGLGPEHADDAADALVGCLRTLRRVGLRDRVASLLEAMVSTWTGDGWSKSHKAKLGLAGGLAYLGRLDRARPLLEAARKAVRDPATPMAERLKVSRSLARASGHAPEEHAIAALVDLADELPKVTDSLSTNSHFCLSVVSFMEGLVLGITSEDLALGEIGKRWLDEDEYLVRRRVHRDLERAGG
jgi:hypothetical protein